MYKQGTNFYPKMYAEEAKIKLIGSNERKLLNNSEDGYEWL